MADERCPLATSERYTTRPIHCSGRKLPNKHTLGYNLEECDSFDYRDCTTYKLSIASQAISKLIQTIRYNRLFPNS